jgi:FimV-like protein
VKSASLPSGRRNLASAARSSSTSSTCRSIRASGIRGSDAVGADGQWHDARRSSISRAYQEMGDTDGAREIPQEALHEGDQQKSEARSLLAKLAS